MLLLRLSVWKCFYFIKWSLVLLVNETKFVRIHKFIVCSLVLSFWNICKIASPCRLLFHYVRRRAKHSRDERWCFVVRQTDQPQTVGVLTSRHKEAWMFLSYTAWPVRYVTIKFFEHVEVLCLSNIWFYGVDMLGLYRTIEDISKKTSKYDIDFVFDWKHSKSVFIDMISWQTSLM